MPRLARGLVLKETAQHPPNYHGDRLRLDSAVSTGGILMTAHPQQKPAKEPAKGLYQHYKGAFHQVLGIAEAPETMKRLVVYQAIGLTEVLLSDDTESDAPPDLRVISTPTRGELAVCSIERFMEFVDG